jgi:hypothetical protein
MILALWNKPAALERPFTGLPSETLTYPKILYFIVAANKGLFN